MSSEGEEAVVVIPIIVKPIQVEVALRIVLVEVSHVAVVIDLRNRASYEILSVPLPLEYSRG
jgi:hypothetical protein